MWNPLFLASVPSFSIIVEMGKKIAFWGFFGVFFILTHEI